MQLENYTNINIFKRAFEQTQIPDANDMIAHSHNKCIDLHAKPTIKQDQFNPY